MIQLIGNLGDSPTMRYTPSGVPVTNFSLAVNKTWLDANGNKQERTTWYRVSCWRKQAETVSQYLTKGSRVLVIGEDIEAKAYQNRAGEWVASLEVTAHTVRFLSPKGEGGNEATPRLDELPDKLPDAEIPF